MTTDKKMNEAQLKAALKGFTGTENWYRHQLFRAFNYTDGVRFLAMEAGAYWLIDRIFGLQYAQPDLQRQDFQFWKITVNQDRSAVLKCTDGNYTLLHEEKIEYTDFVISEYTLYLTDNVLLLPSEY